MLDIKLLDCTLRDGGFCNDWHFGRESIEGIFRGLAQAGIDIIEVGFLDERRPFDGERSIMPDTDSVKKIYGHLPHDRSLVVGMIDYGTCSLDKIAPRERSVLDGIRVIFKKPRRHEALRFCAALKSLGYLVFVQPVSVTDYTDEELFDLAHLVNDLRPRAISVVDTYGLLHEDRLLHYFDMLHRTLKEDISLGYHAHNNLQLACANCIAIIKRASALGGERSLILDASLLGMGKSAGNTPLELLALYLDRYAQKQYDLGTLLSLIDRYVAPSYTSPSWGYSTFYFLAAACECHPNYVAYLKSRGFDAGVAHALLNGIKKEKRLSFDKAYIEALCHESGKERYEALPL